MSKGIIIVDIPENCDQCLVRHPGLAYCQIARKSTSHSSTGKPLNEKKKTGMVSDQADAGGIQGMREDAHKMRVDK